MNSGAVGKTVMLGMVCVVVQLASSPILRAQTLQISPEKNDDLTYHFDATTVYWPNAKSFDRQKEYWDMSPRGYWYAAGRYFASEHEGTHIDAPIHFSRDGATVDQISSKNLIAPAVVIDVSETCAKNNDYRLTVDDITAWGKQHGRIPDGTIVLARTGWGKYWPDKKRYLGSDVPGDINILHFPAFSVEAARFLVSQRKINGVGIDTASMNYGPSRLFEVHGVILAAGLYGLENVAHLDRLPITGATIIALPMKIKGGSGRAHTHHRRIAVAIHPTPSEAVACVPIREKGNPHGHAIVALL